MHIETIKREYCYRFFYFYTLNHDWFIEVRVDLQGLFGVKEVLRLEDDKVKGKDHEFLVPSILNKQIVIIDTYKAFILGI